MVERALRVLGHANSRVGILLRKLFYEKKILPDGEVLVVVVVYYNAMFSSGVVHIEVLKQVFQVWAC